MKLPKHVRRKLVRKLAEAAAYECMSFDEIFPGFRNEDDVEIERGNYTWICCCMELGRVLADESTDSIHEYIESVEQERLLYQTCTDGSAQQVRMSHSIRLRTIAWLKENYEFEEVEKNEASDL